MSLGITDVVETLECRAALNEGRDAACKAIALRITLAELGREHVGQLDLRDLGLDLRVRHSRVDVMLESILRQQSDKKLLGEVGVSVVLALLYEEAGTF